jgi:hypothetical protein
MEWIAHATKTEAPDATMTIRMIASFGSPSAILILTLNEEKWKILRKNDP